MHIGIALQRPVIAFFGPSSDAEIDLFGLGEKIVTPLSCGRCYLADCDVRPHCMGSISVSELYSAVNRWL
jgi:heptosyltransferase-2